MSLGLLVGRFAALIIEQPMAQEPAFGEEDFPEDLARIREAFGHHIVSLLLLARSDGESVLAERQVILQHCVSRGKEAGLELSLEEQAALSDYLYEFRPSEAQLRPALKRLEQDSKDHIVALIEAAIAVVDADGERRPREVHFLQRLSRDLAEL